MEHHYPTYVVCAWLGNTPTVAHKHYLTVTDEHFEVTAKTGDKRGMQTPVSCRTHSQEGNRTVHFVRENASSSEVAGILETARVAEEGLERNSVTRFEESELRQSPKPSGAKCGALGAADAKLAEIAEALPHLPPPAIEIILQTVRAFRD